MAAVGFLLFVGRGGILENPPAGARDTALAALLVALQSVPLLARRRWPIAVLTCVVAGFAGAAAPRPPGRGGGPGVLLATSTLGPSPRPVPPPPVVPPGPAPP